MVKMLDITLLSFYNCIILQYTTYDYFIHLMHRCAHLYTLILSVILETVAIYWNINYDIMGNHGQTLRYVLLPSLTTLCVCIVLLFCSEKWDLNMSQYVSIILMCFAFWTLLNNLDMLLIVIICVYNYLRFLTYFTPFYTKTF